MLAHDACASTHLPDHLVGTGVVRCRRQLWRVHTLRTSPAIASGSAANEAGTRKREFHIEIDSSYWTPYKRESLISLQLEIEKTV